MSAASIMEILSAPLPVSLMQTPVAIGRSAKDHIRCAKYVESAVPWVPHVGATVTAESASHMNEIVFLVEEAAEGGYTARALGESVFTEADDLASLRDRVRDAVRCHFDEGKSPQVIRLHFSREEVIAT